MRENKIKKRCTHHPERAAYVFCTQCREYFCEECTNIRMISNAFTAYICKDCSGKCERVNKKISNAKQNIKVFDTRVVAGPGLHSDGKKDGVFIDKQPDKKAEQEASNKKEKRPNFFTSLLGAAFYPFKGKGILITFVMGAVFFMITEFSGKNATLDWVVLSVFATYLLLYLYKIIDTSCYGEVYLPYLISPTDWKNFLKPLLRIGLSVYLPMLPSVIYFLIKRQIDVIFIFLVSVGIFLLPMLFTGVTVEKSFFFPNVFKAVKNIVKTFWSYCLLCLFLLSVIFVCAYVSSDFMMNYIDQEALVSKMFTVYFLFVFMRSVGMFAHCYKERIL